MDEIEHERIELGTVVGKIVADMNPESPREWDNVGTMVCSHRRYNLGDEHQLSSDDFAGSRGTNAGRARREENDI